jgi:hypothetical protein
MNWFEDILLNINLSWFSVRIMPFILIQSIAILVCSLLIKTRIFNLRILKITFFTIIFCGPISIYFYFYPIYRGDLFELGGRPNTKIEFPKQKKLVVFVLPDCPYCHESIYFIEKLLKRNSNMEIEIWICGNQEDSFYNSNHSKKLKISRINEFERTLHLTQGIFPTYTISEKQKLVKRWTNQSFGVRSLDEIEAFFEVHK